MGYERRQREIDDNLEFFLQQLPQLMAKHGGQYAVIRNRAIVGYFDTVLDAVKMGNTHFPDRLFSVQKITDNSYHLGCYSHAMHLGASQ